MNTLSQMTGTTTKQQSRITDALSILEKSIALQKDLVSDLYQKLDMVMTPPCPAPENPAGIAPPSSELAMNILNQVCNVGELNRILREILDRLEL